VGLEAHEQRAIAVRILVQRADRDQVRPSGERELADARDLAFAEELARRAAIVIERRKLEEEAELASRMKDEFLATISHELRTPLQAILGYASMLERGVVQDVRKALAVIVRNASAQARLVEDMLDMSRITSGKLRLTMGPVALAAAIRTAIDALRPAATARRIELVERLPDDLGVVHGDSDRLQQVVWNLVSNAVKFTDPGGTVEIAAERSASAVRVTVRDTGRGIAREHLSTIFERFRQLDGSPARSHGGLGLGLAIVRALVEAHGGVVEAQSEGPGRGTTFVVMLPSQIVAVASGRARAAGPSLGGRPLHGIQILVVEDDADGRELIAEALIGAGARVECAGSAPEAYARLQAEPPQVLVSDIGMPDEDGYSLLRRIRELPPEQGGDVPAIALTAYARPEDVRRTEEAGFQLYLAKPVTPDRLVAAVRTCVPPSR
jgi:signal transduction histidine kinase/CheY-like chemotaxis protein